VERRVVLIFGPAGAGKTTLARSIADAEGLTVYDRDDAKWSSEREFRSALVRIGRNRRARAVVIRSGASRSARGKSIALVDPTEVRVIETPLSVCIRNIRSRGRNIRTDAAAAKSWWRRYEPGEPVMPPPKKRKLSPTQRGYGGRHKALRKKLTPLVEAGGVNCARCGKPIIPGEPWDLGHVDGSRVAYQGPEHRKCNRATSGRNKPSGRSRDW
jgi:hypothetical protein